MCQHGERILDEIRAVTSIRFCYIRKYTHCLIVGQIHALFQSHFSILCDLVFPISYSISSLILKRYTVAAWFFLLVFKSFPSITCACRQFLSNVKSPVWFLRLITCRIFRCSLPIGNLLTYLLIYLLTYLLTPWCRVLLEKLTSRQLVKKFSAFHGTRRFITALTSVRHLSLSWASPIWSIYPHPTSWRSILILYTHLRLGLCSGLFHSGFPTTTLYTPLSSPICATRPTHLILLDVITRTILGEEYKSFSSSLCNLLRKPTLL